MRDPSRFIAVPSRDDPGAAPEGAHTLYALEPVPNLAVGRLDWEKEGPLLRDRLHAFLGDFGHPTDIVTEELVTPADWHAQGMEAGTPFSLPTRCRRPDPSDPATSIGGSRPGSPVPEPRRAWASRWC